MRLKMLTAMVLLGLVGCGEEPKPPIPVDGSTIQGSAGVRTYKYRITHHLGPEKGGEVKVYLTDDWSWCNDPFITFVNPKTGRSVWLSGTIEAEEGPFQEVPR